MSKAKNVIHSDADKEEARGSFGYSDIFLYKFMSFIIFLLAHLVVIKWISTFTDVCMN